MRIRACVAVLVVAGALLVPATAQQPAAKAVIDDAWVRAAVVRIVPAVERACGRRFRTPPTVGLADAGDVMRSLRDDLEPSVAAFFAGQPRARIQKAIQLRADLIGSSVLGKYGFVTREIYLLPHQVGLNLGFLRLKDLPVHQVLELVLAHELVHALQDQECDLRARTQQLTDADAAEAFAMLTEGHAVFCSERAARELDLNHIAGPLRQIFAGRRELGTIPGADLSTRRVRGDNEQRYLRGARYMAAQHAAGGDERLWQLLADPAPRTRTILAGEVVGTPCRVRLDVFPGCADDLAGPNWTIGTGAVPEVRLLCENLPRGDDLLVLLPQLEAAGEWFAVAPTPASWRALYALRFADAAAAERFVGLVVDVATNDMKHSETSFTSEPLPAWPEATGRVLTQAKTRSAPLAASAQLVLVQHGRFVLQASSCNAPMAPATIAAVAQRVLAALATGP